jgi:hypothetical protein
MFVASKETVQKFISFIWETALKPRIFEKWWIADMDLSRINPKNESSEYITSVLRNDFEDSLISEKFLRGYTEIKLKSLDISQENKLMNNFFSEKKNWPKWIENTKEIKLVEKKEPRKYKEFLQFNSLKYDE